MLYVHIFDLALFPSSIHFTSPIQIIRDTKEDHFIIRGLPNSHTDMEISTATKALGHKSVQMFNLNYKHLILRVNKHDISQLSKQNVSSRNYIENLLKYGTSNSKV